MTLEAVSPKTLHRFSLENFSVEDVLIGRRFKFLHEGKEVTVKLPRKSRTDPYSAVFDSPVGRVTTYRSEVDGQPINAIYELGEVRFVIQMTESFRVPRKIPADIIRPSDALSKKDQQRLLDTASGYGLIANQAFGRWLRVLRWKTGLGLLGRGAVEDFESEHGAGLIDPRSGKDFGGAYHYRTMPWSQIVTDSDWKASVNALKRVDEPPIWVEWLFEGQLAQANGNIGGALANFAIACESFLTAKLFEEFPKSIKPEALDVFRDATFGPKIVNKYAKKRFPHFKDWSRVNKLFGIRNDVFHKGASPVLNKQECEKLGDAVHALIYGAGRR